MAAEPEIIIEDVVTPLAGYANAAHEMYTAMFAAGFDEEQALEIVLAKLPDWEFPLPDGWEWEYEDDVESSDEDEDD